MPVDEPASASRRTLLAGLGAMLASGCSRVAFMAANVPAAFGSYRRHTDISYRGGSGSDAGGNAGAGSSVQHRLDVYVPDKKPAEPRPLIVFLHGGRWTVGDKSDYRFVGAALTELGCVAVLPNYRLYPEVKMPGFMEDAACAASWSASHAGDFGADPSQLFLMGHSSGAHMAALAALDPRYFAAIGQPVPRVAGVIGLSGPYDFLPLREADVQDMFGPPEKYPISQPINFVSSGAPPMLLVHGLKDTTVSPNNSRSLAAALGAHGVPVTLKLYPKLGHGDTVAALSKPARGRAPTLAEIAAFVKRPRSS